MANATLNSADKKVLVTTEKTIRVPTNVSLNLTLEEAVFIRTLLSNIGGIPSGPRGYADSVAAALDSAKVRRGDVERIGNGSIYFDRDSSGIVKAAEAIRNG